MFSGGRALFGIGDTGHEFSQDGKIQNDGRCQGRVSTLVDSVNGVTTAHGQFRGEVVNGNLLVSDRGHVLDHDTVSRLVDSDFAVLALLTRVEKVRSLDGIVNLCFFLPGPIKF